MANNTVLNPGVAGDTIRDIDKSGVKTQVVTLDVGGAGAETLLAGTVPVSGTVALSATTQLPASLGSKADADSLAVTQSTEDKAVQTAIAAVAGATSGAAVTTDTTGTIQQYLRGIVTKMVAQLPASLGSKAAASALAVTDSTEDIARMGIITETAPASDTASSGLNGRLQRIAQNLTTSTTALGTKVTSITALETGGVGIIGWLSQIWRDIKGGVVLQAGTNAIGKLAANTGVTIGAVELAASQTLATVTTVGTLTTLTGGGVASGASDSGNPVKVGGRYNSSAPTLTNGQRGDIQLDASGNTKVAIASGGIAGVVDDAAVTVGTTEVLMIGLMADETATDSVNEGDGGMARMTLDRKAIVNAQAHSAGGTSLNSLIAPSTPAKNVLTSAASQIYSITAFNLLATPVYLKIWDNVTGSVTLGTTACNYQYMIPGNTAGTGFAVNFPVGIVFATGIITAVTSAIGTTDNTSTTANSIIVNIGYK